MEPVLAVVVPSRGLMFSETLEELLRELDDYGGKYRIYWAHGKSLPRCFNDPTTEALQDPDVFAILYCEDDMIIPKGILKKMFAQNYPAVALDYPFKMNGDSTTLHDPNGFAYWTGTGFLLVARSVLDAMPKPIWRTDRTWDTFIRGNTLVFWPRRLKKIAYGLHDLNFGIVMYSQGVPVKPMMQTAGQRKLIRLGAKDTNKGAHNIRELTAVGHNMVIKTLDERSIEVFKRGMARVEAVEIMDHKPDYITYVDGQAMLNTGEKYELV